MRGGNERDERNAAIVASYRSGLSQEAVAKQFGIGVWSVRKALEEAGAFPTKEEAERRRRAAATTPAANAKRANSIRRPLEDRFYRKVAVDLRDEGACWKWLGAKDTKGYGQLRVDGRNKLATHVSLELNGLPRPFYGAFALHSCDNPECTNPKHLRWGTQKENMQDAANRGRADRSGLELGRIRREPPRIVDCCNCGKSFETSKERLQTNIRHFCSTECCWTWQSEHFTGARRAEFGDVA